MMNILRSSGPLTLAAALLVLTAAPLTAKSPIIDVVTNPGQAGPEGRTAQSIPLPRAEPNDQRTPAGQIVDGVLRLELEALEAEWYPRGPDGPRVVTSAFAEVGRPPQVPGPLIRAAAGTPVHVTIRNTLDRPIAVRGLLDRASMAPENSSRRGPFPAFAFSEPVVVPPGDEREARFTPTQPVSSFYYAQAVPPGSEGPVPPVRAIDEGGFMGALVVDPAEGGPPPDERVLMITHWASPAEPGAGISWKMMLNGQSWPFTERLEYTVGDSVRWRVINASAADHPMHLHGFFFTVDAVGDTQADTTHPPTARPLAVTQMMEVFSSLRLTWVPEEPGNWLFHCHLVRHMGEVQRFQVERDAPGRRGHGHDMEGMAGLVTGITVHPAPGHEAGEEVAARRLDLWTGERPGVYGGKPELGFVVQEGSVPAGDSTRVPGSPLVLTRGEPTEIIVHNRLDFPLSVHWHGLELPSLYDGVGGWSGHPGETRPPIAPGDSVRVFITPPRAGTFMYHTHGEPEHELSQGLYGPFLVLEPGEERDAEADRVFLLAARGAERDAVPAINGVAWPAPERFEVGRTYRLRFLHISPDAFKRVRLLEDGEPVRWRPIAKDGADLPEGAQGLGSAILRVGVGETYDVEWTPEAVGVHVLEVITEFYPSLGGFVTQRVAFGVGDVDEADLVLPPAVELPIVEVSVEERARYTGTFLDRPSGAEPDIELILNVWEEGEGLYTTGVELRGEEGAGTRRALFPLGEHAFESGRDLEGLIHLMQPRYRFIEVDGGFNRLELEFEGGFTQTLERGPESETSGGVSRGEEDRLDWVVGDAPAAGFDADALERLAAEIEAGDVPNTHALLIEHDGHLVFERYFSGSDERWGEAIPERAVGADSLHDVRSASKSVTSVLLGIALGEDFEAALARPIGDYLPGLELGAAQREITLDHVLTMTPGLDWNEMDVPYTDPTNDEIRLYRAGDPARHVMSRPVVHEPGSTWYYSGGATQLLASVITEMTGQRLDDFARDHLFGPLGITDFEWLGPGEWTPDNPSAMSGLRLTARDFAKIGSLYLHGGRWQGRQVVPEAWVSRSVIRHIDDTGDYGGGGVWGYGYQWWIGDLPSGPRVVSALGNGDQCLHIVPGERLAVTVFGGRYNQPPTLCLGILERVLAARGVPGGDP